MAELTREQFAARFLGDDPEAHIELSWKWWHEGREPHRSRYRWMLKHVVGPVVVDVGCGSGLMCCLVSRKEGVRRVCGFDLCERAVGEASQRLREAGCVNATAEVAWAEALPLPANTADCAVLGEVLEHVYDPVAAVYEAARVVKAGGPIIVTVPEGGELSADHLRVFGTESLEALLSAAGAVGEIERMKPWLMCVVTTS